MRGRPQTAFGDHVDALLKERGLSVAAFGRLVGLRTTSVSAVKRQNLNPKRFDQWADALGLSGKQRAQFIELAWLAHAPPFIQLLVERQRQEIFELQKKRARVRP